MKAAHATRRGSVLLVFPAFALGVLGCMSEHRVGILIDNMPPSLDGDVVDDAAIDAVAPGDDGAAPGDDGGSDATGETGTMIHFNRILAGQPLPTESACAALIHRGDREQVPENSSYNQVVPTAAQVSKLTPFGDARGFDNKALPLGKRVTGNFTGTTDEILRWAACKWGFDEDFVRADAYQTNGWHQSSVSAWTGDFSSCPPNPPTRLGPNGSNECPQVFSLFGITWKFYQSAWPMIRDSTAFAVDFSLGLQRVCFEGYSSYFNGVGPAGKKYGPNDEFGCAASFYTGAWYDFPTIQQVNRITR